MDALWGKDWWGWSLWGLGVLGQPYVLSHPLGL